MSCDTALLGAHRPGDTESRALPRRKGSSPGSTMSRAPRGHRLRLRAFGETRAESESIEASHMRWFYPLHGGVTRPGTRAAKRRAPREEPRCLRYVRMERVSKIALRRPAATGLRWRRRLLLKEHGDARRADAFFTLRPPPPLTGTEAAEGSTCLAGGASPKRALCSECRSQRRERRLRPRSCAG